MYNSPPLFVVIFAIAKSITRVLEFTRLRPPPLFTQGRQVVKLALQPLVRVVSVLVSVIERTRW
jgi:hypothetical protein